MAQSSQPRLAVRIAGWCAIIILPLLAIEAIAAIYYTVRDGRFISVRTRLAETSNAFVNAFNSDPGCRYIDALYPHPYLAYVYKYDPQNTCGIWSNSTGFLGREFPLQRDPTKFTILLTGGSVAGQFAQTRKGGPYFLEEELNRCFKPPHGEQFVVLNGTGGGWKQPIMAVLFLLYGEAFDGVVSLEGFNEHYSLPYARLEAPSNNFVTTNPLVSSYQKLASAWLANEMIRYARENLLLSRSFASYAVVDAARRYLESVDDGPEERRKTFESIFRLPSGWTADQKIAFNIEQYRKCIRSTDTVAKSRAVQTAFFIQPVPAIGKVLTDEERRAAGNLEYAPLYRQMTEGLLELSKEGIPVFSLLDVFADHSETLYSDHVHLKLEAGAESPGFRILAGAVARHVGAAWKLSRKC